MPRARTPVAAAKVSGADAKNPQRHRNRRSPKGIAALGAPPSWFDQYAKRAWTALKKELPWLSESHRGVVELTALLRGKVLETRGPTSHQGMQELRRLYGMLGASPADESKVQFGNGDEEDPDEEFFSGGPKLN